jgi:hypothetical protein
VRFHSGKSLGIAVAGLAMTAITLFSGCSSSSSSKPQVSGIVFSDANGVQQTAPTSLTANSGTYLYANVTNDKQFLGVDWTVSCGSQLPPGTPLPPGQVTDTSCGTFSPVHTLSGPIPSYTKNGSGILAFYTAPAAPPANGIVTLYASATSDHSKFTSITLTILGVPITIGFVTTPPSSLTAGSSTSLNAVVGNDYSSKGVSWSVACGDSDCGSLSSAQTPSGVTTTFTAPASVPAGQTVTVIATSVADSTKVASATITILPTTTASMVRGKVLAGSQPVNGASVFLYAAGENGYGSPSTLLNTSGSTTDNDGSFIFNGIAGNCPSPASQVYLVAKGGSTPFGANPNLTLMTALGSCESIGSLGQVIVNEVTTVGSVYPLAAFMTDTAHIGTAGNNIIGLTNAFSVANNLVNIATGEARTVTRAGNGAVPQAKINTIADALNRCSGSGDGSACGTLFSSVEGVSAKDTIQAALYLAQHPATSSDTAAKPEGLWEMPGAGSPFQPVLSAAPKDWSLALDYTPAGIGHTQAIAFDEKGNAWIAGSSGVTKLSSTGAAAPGSPFTDSALTNGKSLAVDMAGNAWVLNDGNAPGVVEFDSRGTVLSPRGGYTSGITRPSSIAADTRGNVWVLNGDGNVSELNSKDGTVLRSMSVPSSGAASFSLGQTGDLWIASSDERKTLTKISDGVFNRQAGLVYDEAVVIDAAGRVWRNDASGKDELPSYNNVESDLPSAGVVPPALAIDPSGNLWTLNKSDNTVSEFIGVAGLATTPDKNVPGNKQ